MKLLVIRPQPGADATAGRILTAGHEAVVMPLFEVQRVAWDAPSPDNYDALLLTSGNAVREAGEGLDGLRGVPVFAVGSATANAAHNRGLTTTAIGDSNVSDLLDIAKNAGQRHLLWLAGEDRLAVPVPDKMTLDIRVVYRITALSAPDDFVGHVRSADAVLLHSPRAAFHFAVLCDELAINRAVVSLAALSPAIAESAGWGWHAIITAPAPNDAVLLSQLQSYFRNIDGGPLKATQEKGIE